MKCIRVGLINGLGALGNLQVRHRLEVGCCLTIRLVVRHYVPKTNEIPETPDLLVIGEDMYAIVGDSDEKPIRILSDFSFFDAARDMEMLSLSTMDNNDRHFEGAGLVSAYHLNEEDDGQLEDSEEENHRPQFVRLTAILRYGVNYAWNNEQVNISSLSSALPNCVA
jgi:DNA (cytosine-5)-methyltransferase 1